jgi:hypothetical protein
MLGLVFSLNTSTDAISWILHFEVWFCEKDVLGLLTNFYHDLYCWSIATEIGEYVPRGDVF